jgi:hypothetical protein
MSSAVEVGDVFVLRCVEAGEEDWRRLKVVGRVPSPVGEKTSRFTVQQADAFSETREIAAVTLLEDSDRED